MKLKLDEKPMKVMTISGFGGPEVFSEHDMPEPQAGEGQVIIDVKASSVNPIDIALIEYGPASNAPFPAVLHGDVAGIVSEVRQGVSHLEVGDEVWGCAGGFNGLPSGALAERMLTDAQLITKKPKNLSFVEAAALLVSLTAWLRFQIAHKSKPVTVSRYAGGGGVGHVGIQIAKHQHAIVHTTVSNEQKAHAARELGANETILYRGLSVDDYVKKHTDGRGYDVVFDTVKLGQLNLLASRQLVYGGHRQYRSSQRMI